MPAPKLDELLALDVETKISLATALWDSIVDRGEELPHSEELKTLIEARIAEYEENPDSALPWNASREEILRE